MFRHRHNSRKPNEGMYSAFKHAFPEVGPGTSSGIRLGPENPSGPMRGSTDLGDVSPSQSLFNNSEHDNTFANAQNSGEYHFHGNWRLNDTPLLPHGFALPPFEGHSPSYDGFTPSRFSTFSDPQSCRFHDPKITDMGVSPQLSQRRSVQSFCSQDMPLYFQPPNSGLFYQDPFQNAFPSPQQPVRISAEFLHRQDSGNWTMEEDLKTTPPLNEVTLKYDPMDHQEQQLAGVGVGIRSKPDTPTPTAPLEEQLRFHTTLNAPTAFVQHPDKIPVTYMNKGHVYTLSVCDTTPPTPQPNVPLKYRTYVRVAFEDEARRARPEVFWHLWKESRGENKVHRRGGQFLAVEYVDPSQVMGIKVPKSNVQLEKTSFDGFAITWDSNPGTGSKGFTLKLSVRFHFLSTDFSHSKGVKGVPVRLCVKNELLTPHTSSSNEPEVCYSKVRIFRDHGAERKLLSDLALVKKSIEKLRGRNAQAGKRKRSSLLSKAPALRLSLVMKHKCTYPADSDAAIDIHYTEECLQMTLVGMQDMPSSTRPVSVLFLRGGPGDDPDLHPVKLPGNDVESPPVNHLESCASRTDKSESVASDESRPMPPSAPSPSRPKRKHPAILEEPADQDGGEGIFHAYEPNQQQTKISKVQDQGISTSGFLAVDLDTNYRPPAERLTKPVACIYVRQRSDAVRGERYCAVYLQRCTVQDLVNGICNKFQINPYRVVQVTHADSYGRRAVLGEDAANKIPEGQEMVVAFLPPIAPSAQRDAQLVDVERESESSSIATELTVDGDHTGAPIRMDMFDPLVLSLHF